MTAKGTPRKVRDDTGLRFGDASRIARRHRVSATHVLEVARGNRPGRLSLVETIKKFQQLAADPAAAGRGRSDA